MPFTFSHPAIILPLAKLPKNKISATGLIIGSMSPDFEYFINMEMVRHHGHSWAGLFYYDLPITIICSFLFHLIVRDKLILSLPEVLKNRFANYLHTDWLKWVKRYWYVLAYSSLIGICSHIFWDAFTHAHGFFVGHIPFLQQSSWFFMAEIPNYHLNQIFSSLAGGLFILLVILLPLNEKLNPKILRPKMVFWFTVMAIQFTVLLLRGIESFGDFIATFISGGLIGLILAPLIIRLSSKYIFSWDDSGSQ